MSEETIILFGGTLAMGGMAFALIAFAFFYQKKINKKHLEVQEINNLLRTTELDATTSFLEGQTKEKNRIAAELHDNIASKIAILKLQLNEGKNEINFTSLNDAIDDILTDVRQISHDLAIGMFTEENFIKTLNNYLKGIQDNTSILVITHFHQLELLHQDQVGKYVFNIIQELLHNTLKYAKATAITIEINNFPDDYIHLLYQDNGVGFDSGVKRSGIGLTNIQKRVEMYNGTYYLSSVPGKGMEVNIEIPLK